MPCREAAGAHGPEHPLTPVLAAVGLPVGHPVSPHSHLRVLPVCLCLLLKCLPWGLGSHSLCTGLHTQVLMGQVWFCPFPDPQGLPWSLASRCTEPGTSGPLPPKQLHIRVRCHLWPSWLPWSTVACIPQASLCVSVGLSCVNVTLTPRHLGTNRCVFPESTPRIMFSQLPCPKPPGPGRASCSVPNVRL